MAIKQFKHKYELRFGQPISFYTESREGLFPNEIQVSEQNPLFDINYYLKSLEGKAVLLTEHNISFRIRKSKDVGEESTVTIYNMSDKTRAFLDKWLGSTAEPPLLLKAGYETDSSLPLLFQGNVVSVKEEYNGHTRATTVSLRSGTQAIKEAFTTRSYRAGVRASDVIRDLVTDLRLPRGTLKFADNEKSSDKPIVAQGNTVDFLRRFSKANGYNVWIEDGTINVIPQNYAIANTSDKALNVSSAIGNLLGSPAITNTGTEKTENQNGIRQALTIKLTLHGNVKIADKINLTSKYHNGVYGVEGITHNGDYEGNNWTTELEIVPIDGWEVRSE